MLYFVKFLGSKLAEDGEKKLDVGEMPMLRRMCRVRKLDMIRIERIRGQQKWGGISKKAQKRRLKWYGRVIRREENYVGRRAMEMEVQGRRKRGRPWRGWCEGWKRLLADEVYNRASWRRVYIIYNQKSTPHKSGIRWGVVFHKKPTAGQSLVNGRWDVERASNSDRHIKTTPCMHTTSRRWVRERGSCHAVSHLPALQSQMFLRPTTDTECFI